MYPSPNSSEVFSLGTKLGTIINILSGRLITERNEVGDLLQELSILINDMNACESATILRTDIMLRKSRMLNWMTATKNLNLVP